MFRTIKLLKREVTDDKLRITYRITDTCFSQNIELTNPRHLADFGDGAFELLAIFKVYEGRKLDIVRNLVSYYLSLNNGGSYILGCDLAMMNTYYPTLQYGERYAKLVKMNYDEVKKVLDDFGDFETARHSLKMKQDELVVKMQKVTRWL